MEFQFINISVLIKNKKKIAMISLFIVAYSNEHSLIFESCSLGYLSLSSYVTFFRAFTPCDTDVLKVTTVC